MKEKRGKRGVVISVSPFFYDVFFEGDTFKYKDVFKRHGCTWEPVLRKWIYRPKDLKERSVKIVKLTEERRREEAKREAEEVARLLADKIRPIYESIREDAMIEVSAWSRMLFKNLGVDVPSKMDALRMLKEKKG